MKRNFTKREKNLLALPEIKSHRGPLFEPSALKALFEKWRAEGAIEEDEKTISQDGIVVFRFPDGEEIFIANPRQEFKQAEIL